MKFELLKLMEKGLPYEIIHELELSEFYDWLDASRALDIDRKLTAMNVSMYAHMNQGERNAEFNRLQNERSLLLGDNPYEVSQEGISKTRELLKKQGKVKRVGNNNKRNYRKTEARRKGIQE
jgi:hypothetical protein